MASGERGDTDPHALTWKTVADPAAFAALAPAWEALRRDAGAPSPYLGAAWLQAWWEAFGEASRLRLLVAARGERLVAAAPLMVSRRTLVKLPCKALHFLGTNLAQGGVLAAEDGVLPALFERASRSGGFQILLLKGLVGGSEEEGVLRQELDRLRLPYVVTSEREVYLDVAGGLDDYRAGRKTKFWSNIRNRRRRLEKRGDVQIERHRESSSSEALLEDVFDVSLRSWKGESGSAVGLQENHRRLLTRLFELGSRTGEVDLWILRLDGKAIAYRYLLKTATVAGELDIAYDKEFRALSPGTLLGDASNEVLIAEGIREINLGFDFSWKDEWVPQHREILEFVAFRPGIYPAILRWLHTRRSRAASS